MACLKDLTDALRAFLPVELAQDLVEEFGEMRCDVATRTTGRASPGRFVEGFVQALQYIESGVYDPRPNVDRYLRGLESRKSLLPDGLRICAARIARAMYALRSKRSIAHKNEIDPAIYDLEFLLKAASWMLSELLRTGTGIDMDTAGNLIEQIQVSHGALVEDLGDHRLVLAPLSVRKEILVLLHSHFPVRIGDSQIVGSLSRCNPGTVRKRLHELWRERMLDGDSESGYRLTSRGVALATETVQKCLGESRIAISAG